MDCGLLKFYLPHSSSFFFLSLFLVCFFSSSSFFLSFQCGLANFIGKASTSSKATGAKRPNILSPTTADSTTGAPRVVPTQPIKTQRKRTDFNKKAGGG